MANAPIGFPRLISTRGPWVQQREAQPNYTTDATKPFVAGQFVLLTSGVLVPYIDNQGTPSVALYGLSLDASTLPVNNPEPYSTPFGQNHNPVSLYNGARFIMNVTDGSGTVGSGTTTQAAVTIGTFYQGRYLTGYPTVLGINAAASGTTTSYPFKVVGLYTTASGYSDGDASGDFNGRVIVEINTACIQ
jgi:hypothetical protein